MTSRASAETEVARGRKVYDYSKFRPDSGFAISYGRKQFF